MQRVADDEQPMHNSGRLSDDTVQMLIQKSVEAKQHAYCVYSKFRVGAALLTADGCVFTGNGQVTLVHACLAFQRMCFVF